MEELLVVGVCLVINAVLAGVEMAFVSMGRPELRALAAKGNKKAAVLLDLRQRPERILSVLQIGITLVGALAAAVSGAGAGEVLEPFLRSNYNLSERSSEIISVILVVIPLTYMNVVFGELVPKAISLKKPHAIALAAAYALRFFDKFLSPLVSVLEKSTQWIIRVFFRTVAETAPSTEDILELQHLGSHTKQYVLNMVHAEKKRALDVMVPWGSVDYIHKNHSIREVQQAILSSRHTRLPVLDNGNIIGLIHAKELLAVLDAGSSAWHDLIRPILKVRSLDLILEIFLKIQQNRSHLAVVYDRMSPIGIVTLEDIVEEILGDLFDEDDDGKIRRMLSHRPRK